MPKAVQGRSLGHSPTDRRWRKFRRRRAQPRQSGCGRNAAATIEVAEKGQDRCSCRLWASFPAREISAAVITAASSRRTRKRGSVTVKVGLTLWPEGRRVRPTEAETEPKANLRRPPVAGISSKGSERPEKEPVAPFQRRTGGSPERSPETERQHP